MALRSEQRETRRGDRTNVGHEGEGKADTSFGKAQSFRNVPLK